MAAENWTMISSVAIILTREIGSISTGKTATPSSWAFMRSDTAWESSE